MEDQPKCSTAKGHRLETSTLRDILPSESAVVSWGGEKCQKQTLGEWQANRISRWPHCLEYATVRWIVSEVRVTLNQQAEAGHHKLHGQRLDRVFHEDALAGDLSLFRAPQHVCCQSGSVSSTEMR